MALDIYSKGTTDTLLAAKLDLAGGTMTGGLTLSASGIIFSDSTYLTTAPAGSTLAADQLTAGVVTANPTAGPTASGDVLKYDGTGLVWGPGGGGTPFNGGAITNPITIAGATIDSEMSSDFFGIELSADTTKGSVLYYTGLDTYDGSSHMLVGPTGLTFPDATTQTTAGYPNSNPSGFQTASDVSTYVTGLGYLTDAPVDGFAYNRKNGAWEIAGSGGSVAWGAISGTLSDQTDLQTALNAKWTPESGDLSLGGYSITNGNVNCSAGYVTAMNFTVTSGGTITFPDSTTQSTAGIGDAPSDGFAYNRKDGAWEIAGSGGSVAWGAISGTVTDQTDLVTYVTGLGYQTASDVSTYVGANAYPLSGNPSGFLTSVPGKTVYDASGTVPYTLQASDSNNIVFTNNSSAGTGIVVPEDSTYDFPIGTVIMVISSDIYNGIGQGGSSVTINGTSGAQVGSVVVNLVKTASNTWFFA